MGSNGQRRMKMLAKESDKLVIIMNVGRSFKSNSGIIGVCLVFGNKPFSFSSPVFYSLRPGGTSNHLACLPNAFAVRASSRNRRNRAPRSTFNGTFAAPPMFSIRRHHLACLLLLYCFPLFQGPVNARPTVTRRVAGSNGLSTTVLTVHTADTYVLH
jgi:hypothetical protein